MKSKCDYKTLELLPEYTYLADFINTIPELFRKEQGTLVYKGRNLLRQFEYKGISLVVKSFHRPRLINRFVYGILRPSKAKRAFRNAQLLLRLGIGTPHPIGYMNIRRYGLFDQSYLITKVSECTHRYGQIMDQPEAFDDVLQTLGRDTAHLHEAGYWHKDFGRGNILFERDDEGKVHIDLVDLNRMGHGIVDIQRGCQNFERLPATPHMHRVLAEAYAKERNYDPDECYRLMVAARQLERHAEAY